MTSRYLLICILVVLTSCSPVHWKIIEKGDCTPSLLSPQTILLDSTLSVLSWSRVGDHVVMTVPNDNAVIHVYSYPEFEFESQYLLYGRAADEYLSANLVEGNINDTFALYDMNNKFIKEYAFNSQGISEISKVDLKGKNTRRSSVLPPYVNILRISDDVHLFRIADATIEELRLIGLTDWKEYGDLYDMLTIRDKNVDQYMDYFCCLDATSDYIVRAYETIDKIDIYKFDNEQFHPWLSIESTPLQITGNSYYFDVDCACNSFAVSRYHSEDKCNLEVYDYSGRILYAVPTEHLIYNIIYDESESKIYAFSDSSEEPTVLEYNLVN